MVSAAVGWTASAVVLVTTVGQIVKQWRDGTSKGVSPWLFVGELVSALLFLWYAVAIHNAVYIATNALMIAASIAGLAIVAYHRGKSDSGSAVSLHASRT